MVSASPTRKGYLLGGQIEIYFCLKNMKKKKQILYSLADWRFHKNKLGYDDIIDKENNLIIVISVMDIACDEVLQSSFYDEKDKPKKLFILDNDNTWSVYVRVNWLTPKIVQNILKDFGALIRKEFIFEPYTLPKNLTVKFQKKVEQWNKEVKEISQSDIRKSKEFFKKIKLESKAYKSKLPKKIPNKRLLQLITHKMKF